MESMKEKITSWLKYFQDYINSFSFVEKEKNIFYFSKFSLDISEFYLIHEFVKTLKENIFKENIEQFRYCLKNIILLEKDKTLSEKEKIIILYSACLFIYYKKFRFNTNCSFENYFDDEFIHLSKTIFKFEIKNNELFKIFAFYYFSIIQKQILALDYTKIQKLKKYYNYLKAENNNEEDIEMTINNGSTQKVNEGFQGQVLTFLISAKEKIIDLVFETSDKSQNQENNLLNLFPYEINAMNNRFQKLNNNLNLYMNFENMDKSDKNEDNKKLSDKNLNLNMNKTFDSINDSKTLDNKSEMNVDESTPQKPKAFKFNNNKINIMNNDDITNNNISKESNSNFVSYMKTDCSNKNNNINNINDNSLSTNINNFSKKNTIISNNSGNFNNSNSTINAFPLNDSLSVPLLNNFDSIFIPEKNKSNQNNKNNNNIYSKRIISELIKNEFDNKTMEIIDEVSKIIDEKYLDKFLNAPSKTVTMIQYFCCYVVEFTPDMLQNICPQYKDVLKNFGIKFIVLAKELYNITMEIFSTIYDLSYTNFDTFIDLTRDCGIQLQHAQGLYKIFRDYSITLFNEKKRKGGGNNIMNVLRKLYEQENQNWKGIIKQKANEFTNFYKI